MSPRKKNNGIRGLLSRMQHNISGGREKSRAEGETPKRRKRRAQSGLLPTDVAFMAAMVVAVVVFLLVLGADDGRLTVYVCDDGATTQYRAWPATAEEFISNIGVTVRSEDSLSCDMDAEIADGMTLEITRAYPVAVQSAGECKMMYLSSGTVGQALSKAGVVYKADDDISEPTFKDIEPGMKITHTAVDISYAISYKTLDYDEEIIKDDDEYESYKKIEVEGKDGKKQVTQRIVVKDGVEVSREVVDQIVTEEAVDQVVRVGTKIRYQTGYVGETRRWKEAPKDGENGWKSMKVDKITAYCTGTRTATGTKPKLGTIAINPYYFKYGTQIYVRGYGYGVARDTGAFRKYTNSSGKPMNQLDLWFNTRAEALKWGTKYDVTIWYK